MIEQIQNLLAQDHPIVENVIMTVIVLLILWFMRQLILRFVYQRTDDLDVVYSWRKTTETIAIALGLIAVFSIWISGSGLQSVSTYLGLVSAGIAIALQDPLTNLIGWLFILTRRPFEVGDRIQIGDVAGDVIDLRYFQISLLEIGNWVDAEQSTGRIVFIPNRFVFNHTVANYTRGIEFIWNEIAVEVTFESNWRAAKELLQEIAVTYSLQPTEEEAAEIRDTAKRSNIRTPRMTPVVYTKVAESGVILTLRYLCRPRRRRGSAEQIWEAILELFASRDDMDFAYKTQRVFYHPREGKTLSVDHAAVAHPRPHFTAEELTDDIC